MIDTRLNFKQQVEHVATKASGVRTLLSRLMPNIGGPKQKRRALLSTVVTSVMTYGIPIWTDALQFQESRRKIANVYRQSALRVASAYRTVSEDAVRVIAGMLPIEVLAEERRCLYRRTRHPTLSPNDLREEERRNSTRRWQVLWDISAKGRCPRFSESQSNWEVVLQREVLPENLMEAMMSSQAAWQATSNFAAAVMKELRSEERKRKAAA
ncbi:uncharacterized protein LOC107042530 [Diachasma alloeum]|uniref:uncharacterized protein LOC107042530 n=1 Tax=Diachasma alloeum TaxID=454923 RepID=UPI000738286E|nr:uncharacterized protein LOC107042530 [Diachasma alloeum]